MAANSTDDSKQNFIKLLHKLFQLDKPELDFGLYRIMHAKSDQLSRFISEDLSKAIEAAFAEQGEQQLVMMRQNIEEKRKQAEELGAPDPETVPAVKQAQVEYEVAKREQNASSDIFDHLYRFFSRYYDKGDFMSRRRHVAESDSRAAPYAVPYDGREVYLHWANKDQYYVKSSETLANFTFNLNDALKKLHGNAAQAGLGFDTVDQALKIHCRVVDATEGEHNDVKESTERFFIIHDTEPVRLEGADLVLQFEYRPDPDKNGQSSTWQKKRLEEAEEAIMQALRATDGVAAYRDGLATPAPTDKQKDRTLLRKYLQQYTARNTMDYFIHKDLGGFLSRELDFYIKNEILRLDDIDDADVLIVEQQLKKIQVLRKISKQIIAFLAQLENFQKKLWLKKKFVTETGYCITLDFFCDRKELLNTIFKNKSQIEQWKELYGIDVEKLNEKLISKGPESLIDDEYYRFLMVDTALFGKSVCEEMLSHLEGRVHSSMGVLVNSDNFQALRFFDNKYYNSFSSIYIDPPYNTDASSIAYKNGYKDSSWMSMIYDRIQYSSTLLKDDSVAAFAIDDVEFPNLSIILKKIFGKNSQLGVAVVRSNPAGRSTPNGISECHDYTIFIGNSPKSSVGRLPRNEKQISRYSETDSLGKFEWVNFRKHGGIEASRSARPKMFYPIIKCGGSLVRIPDMTWDEALKSWKMLEDISGEVVVWPIGKDGSEKRWKWGVETACSKIQDLRIEKDSTGGFGVYSKSRMKDEGMRPVTWWSEKEYSATEYGTNLVKEMFGNIGDFSYPKALPLVKDCLRVCGDSNSSLVLDYFGGSGTTAHSIIDLNRGDGGERSYVLIEMGRYFDTVLKPRVQKAAYAKEWRGGKPKPDKDGKIGGISHCFKYLRLESYDDTLNNLELSDNPQRDALMEKNSELRHDYTLKYMLDVETRGSASLLNTEGFRDPEGYKLKIKQPGSDESRDTAIDLVETFNWLIGLHVSHLDKPRTYVARFERETDPELPDDQNTRLKAVSLRENDDGAYWIRQVEGHVRRIPGSDEDLAKVLVVWRKLTDDSEKDAAVLEALLEKYKIGTTDSEFDAIYINGPHGLNLSGSARGRVHSLEETFHARMWEGCEDGI